MYPTAIRMAPSRLGRVPSLKLSVRITAKSCIVKVNDTLYTSTDNDDALVSVEEIEKNLRDDASATSSAGVVPPALANSQVSFILSSLGPLRSLSTIQWLIIIRFPSRKWS